VCEGRSNSGVLLALIDLDANWNAEAEGGKRVLVFRGEGEQSQKKRRGGNALCQSSIKKVLSVVPQEEIRKNVGPISERDCHQGGPRCVSVGHEEYPVD